MKRIAQTIGVISLLGFFSVSASAGDYYYRNVRNQNHLRHHDRLEHRAFHRELVHNDAHRYPMSYRGHGRLHDNLAHDSFHDNSGHRNAHRSRAYIPRYNYGSTYGYGSGVGFRSNGVSFFLGF